MTDELLGDPMSNFGEFWKAVCEIEINILAIEEVPMFAAQAVAAGLEGDLLYELAALPRSSNPFLILEKLQETVDECHIRWPETMEARIWLLHRWIRELSSGRIDPYPGARLIWREVWSKYNKVDRQAAWKFSSFVDIASQWEDRKEVRALAEQESIRLADRLLEDVENNLPKIVIRRS